MYLFGNLFVKRTLRKHEWGKHSNGKQTWTAVPSASMPQRYRNDVAIQEYLRQRTNIPLPAFTQTFEDDGAIDLQSFLAPDRLHFWLAQRQIRSDSMAPHLLVVF